MLTRLASPAPSLAKSKLQPLYGLRSDCYDQQITHVITLPIESQTRTLQLIPLPGAHAQTGAPNQAHELISIHLPSCYPELERLGLGAIPTKTVLRNKSTTDPTAVHLTYLQRRSRHQLDTRAIVKEDF